MAKLDKDPKDPQRKGRADLVKAATAEEWAARPGGKLEKQGRDGLKLVVAKAPDYILDGDGEIVGVDAWVQLFDERGWELPIDPHRRIINPPTVPRAGVQETRGQRGEVAARELISDPVAAFWEAVWDSIDTAPNPRGWRTRGTVTTVYSSAEDGTLISFSSSYNTARDGFGGLSLNTFSLEVGQTYPDYNLMEGFLSFDTSAIADSDVISSVDLSLRLSTDNSTTDFTAQARSRTWGPTLTTGDYVPGGSLSGLTLLATLNTSGIGATGSYKTFTSQAAFLSAPNLKTGTVELVISSDRQAAGNAPSGGENATFTASEASGTTQDPMLTITHAGLGSSPFFTSRPNRIWRLG